jgi:RNA recognition motif-containing protein
MLQEYFGKVKSIHGLKLPMSKFNENKGFAFIYFGSEDDAIYVKKTLDRTAILREKIRVTRTVVS